MFVALKITQEKKKTFFKRLFSKKENKISFDKYRLDNGFFYLIDYRLNKGSVDYDAIKKISGRESRRLVLARDITLPEHCPVKGFRPKAFYNQVLLSGLERLLSQTLISPCKVKLCIYDKEGLLAEHDILRLLPFTMNIKIITGYPKNYLNITKRAIEEYGAPIIISGSSDLINDSNIILATSPLDVNLSKKTLLFSYHDNNKLNLFTPARVKIPQNIQKEIPKQFDIEYFYAAMFEIGRKTSRKILLPENYYHKGREISIKNVINIINNLDNMT